MSTIAVAMMIFSIVILWGGLVFAVVHLVRADAQRNAAARKPRHAAAPSGGTTA